MISIVIPARNERENLEELLSSIRENSYENYEIVVVDGGSTDGTRDVAEDFGAKVVEGPQEGPAVARNIGWERSEGEYVYFLDADRVLGPETLGNVAKAFEENPGVDVYHVNTEDKHIATNWVSKALSAENQALEGKQARLKSLNRIKSMLSL